MEVRVAPPHSHGPKDLGVSKKVMPQHQCGSKLEKNNVLSEMKQGTMLGYIGNKESGNTKNRSKVVKEETVWASFRNVEMIALCDSTHTCSIVESMDWTQ